MALPPGLRLPTLGITALWLRWPFELMQHCAKKFGEPFSLGFLGFPKLVVVYEPETVKAIFADDGETYAAGKFNQSLSAMLGDKSVLMLDGREHMRHRKLLMPGFHGERMQRYGQAMLDETDVAIDQWKIGEPFSLHPSTQDITLRVIVRTVFGITEGARLEEMLRRMKRILKYGSWPPLLIPFMQKDLGAWSPWGKFKRAIADGDEYLFAEIRERRRSGARGDDILSLLLDARDENGEAMTDEELRDELVTLLVAGHETTATALAWAVRWTLATPGLLERVREEIGEEPLTAQRAAEIPIIDAIAREAMRLNPVIPIVGRVLEKDTKVAGYNLEAGTPIACSIVLAQRRPEAFPNPDRFDPDRFLGQTKSTRSAKISPAEFFPFGGGVRRCIGMAFALYEMRIVLARIFERAELSLAPRGKIKVQRRSITLMPSDGLMVRLEKRQSVSSRSDTSSGSVCQSAGSNM